jgi:hypothetical protein
MYGLIQGNRINSNAIALGNRDQTAILKSDAAIESRADLRTVASHPFRKKRGKDGARS